jgi:LysR family transcriptional regulator for bpeEF and oprC
MDQLLALRVFTRIAESGSFSKAADAMDVPRATASKLVQELERQLGVRLLQRTTRRVSLSPDGAAYYERASRLISELDDMNASTAGSSSHPRGRLRVDVGSSLANRLLIPTLAGFHDQYPHLRLDLGVSDRPVDLIGEGVDCVIRGGDLPDSNLVARRLADLEWVTCAAPSYVRKRGRPQHPADLMNPPSDGGHTAVGYFSSLTGRHAPLEFEQAGERFTVPTGTAIAVNESTAHLTALVAGLGVGQTFRFMAAPHLADGSLVDLLPQWHRARHRLSLVYPGSRQLNSKIRVFSDWVTALFAQVDAGR